MLIREQITIGTFVPEGRTFEEMRAYPVWPSLRPVSRGYLTAIRVPVIDGRELEAADFEASTPAIVISRNDRPAVRHGQPGWPIRRWHVGKQPAVQMRVVGVVEDLRNTSPAREPYRKSSSTIDSCWRCSSGGRVGALAERESDRGCCPLLFAPGAIPGPPFRRSARSCVQSIPTRHRRHSSMNRLVASSVARPRFTR